MKKKLIAAAFSLAMAFVLMTSASFAWFTVSTAPEVKDVQVTMQATKNLEIAEASTWGGTAPTTVGVNDSASETNWGAIVTCGASTEKLNFPATIDSNAIKTIDYDNNGRTNGLTATVTAPTSVNDGVAIYKANVHVSSGTNADKNIAMVYCCWLRSNIDVSDLKMKITKTDGTSDKIKMAYAIGAGTDGGYTECTAGSEISITGTYTKNTGYFVRLLFYVDGNSVQAADVASEFTNKYDVKFSSAAVASAS